MELQHIIIMWKNKLMLVLNGKQQSMYPSSLDIHGNGTTESVVSGKAYTNHKGHEVSQTCPPTEATA